MILSGRAWKFGHNLRSTHFFPGKYDPLSRAGKFEELAQHVLEETDPGFIQRVKPGDVLLVGDAFGTGKHLDGPINALKLLGIAAVLGKGFSASWERDSINLGLPSLAYPELYDSVNDGDRIELDLRGTLARNLTSGQAVPVRPVSPGLLEILAAGGIAGYTVRCLGLSETDRASRAH
ncbi:MAG TPA: hypothetical protein VLJ86_08475 [Ramlibacter sp.]|nr:hypothetical protein [Ramlibacter sp.]